MALIRGLRELYGFQMTDVEAALLARQAESTRGSPGHRTPAWWCCIPGWSVSTPAGTTTPAVQSANRSARCWRWPACATSV
ncbi:hypothetical protein ACFSC4_22045 [Deinococcus malanensis]|uniref:hypothetical protein n=1 Tax=Deinococcus malanensis TaxID=1706855 RepID=UPI0036406EE2